MSKREQIDELKKALEEAHADTERLRTELTLFRETNEYLRRAKATRDAAKITLDKLTAENETIRQIEQNGLVSIDALRHLILRDYSVGYNGSLSTAEMRLRLRSNDRVEAALLSALTDTPKPKPKFAARGYMGGGSVHGNGPLDARVTSILNPDGLMFVPRQVQLSPPDRQLLADINNSVKIFVDGSFRPSFGRGVQ